MNVKADFKRGSFGIDLEVIQTFLSHAKSLLIGQDVQAAKTLVELIFGGGGLFALMKWMNGKKDRESAS